MPRLGIRHVAKYLQCRGQTSPQHNGLRWPQPQGWSHLCKDMKEEAGDVAQMAGYFRSMYRALSWNRPTLKETRCSGPTRLYSWPSGGEGKWTGSPRPALVIHSELETSLDCVRPSLQTKQKDLWGKWKQREHLRGREFM